MALQDDDLLLVNRGGDSYKTEYSEIKGEFVEVAGDNMTGNLTLGTDPSVPNITLNADGSGTFAGDVKSLGFLTSSDTAANDRVQFGYMATPTGHNLGHRIVGDGSNLYYFSRENGTTSHKFYVHGSGGSSNLMEINGSPADEKVMIGGSLPSSPNITLNADGSANFTSKVGINRTPSNVSWLGVDLPDVANNYGIYVRSKVNTSNNLFAYATGNQGNTGATGIWYTQGDLEIGTNLGSASSNVKIALNADGSAMFASSYANINSAGTITAGRAGNAAVFIGKTGNALSGTTTSTIYSNGSANFTGEVKIGGIFPDAPNISLKADGSAMFAGKVTSASTEDSDSGTTLVTKDYVDANGGGGGGGGGPAAWGDIASGGAINASLNIANVTTTTNGYSVTFTTPMPTANYAISSTPKSGPNSSFNYAVEVTSQTATGFDVFMRRSDGAAGPNPGFSFSVHANTGTVVGDNSPPGSVIMFAGTTPPTGWLECNGQVAPSALAAVLGQANVPDLRGEFVRGWDNARGIDAGRNLLTTQDEAFKEHKHSTTAESRIGNTGAIGHPAGWSRQDTPTAEATFDTDEVGGTETRPRNVALMYIIKT